MAVYKRDIIDINLETGNIYRSWLKHSIGYKDQKADHFGVRVFRDGEAVSLTGVSVQGVFMPPQGSPIAITSGNIVSGNVAEVVLPQACYNYDGQFTLAIKLVDSTNSVTGTVRIVDGMVDNTHASGTVAPTSAVPTYQEVLSVYEQAIVVIGKSVRFDTDQSLTDAQKTTARTNIAAASTGELNDVKSALNAVDKAVGTKQTGTTTTGAYLNANGALSTGVGAAYVVKTYPVNAGTTYILHGENCRIVGAYPIAVWSLTAADNDGNNREIIIDNTKATTITDYDVTYTPETSGYILIASHTSYNEVQLYVDSTDESMLKTDIINLINDDLAPINKAIGPKQVGTKTTGAYLNENGALVTGAGAVYVVRTYPVQAGTEYILYGKNCQIAAALPMAVWSLTAADNDSNYRTVVIDNTKSTTASDYNVTYTPTTSGYILIASHTSSNEILLYINAVDESMLKINLTDSLNAVDAKATEANVEIDSFESDNFILSPNLFDKASTVDGYINPSTGNVTGDGTWQTSDFIPVDVAKTYYCQAGGTYAFYGASKNFLGYDSVNPIVPIANTKYLRKSVKATSLDAVMLYELPFTLPNEDSYFPYGYIGLKDNMIRKNVSQLVIQTFGDSMVGMGKWQESCRFRLGLKQYINSGHSGYKMSQTGDLGSTPIDTVIEDELDNTANIVTIWGGTNDFYGNATIGNPSDNVNTTFYGALNLATKYLCENKPNVKIMFITPLNRFDDLSSRFPNQDSDGNYINDQGKILEDYVNAMIDVCKRNSIKCLDFYHDGGINKWNESSLMSDGIHPTNDYFAVLGKRIAEELNLLI